jgi:hypothetical protein
MNDKLHTAIQKATDHGALSLQERTRMQETIQAYVAMKPVRANVHMQERRSYFFTLFSMRPVALMLVAVLFISSAGVSYAAEGALPGDALYAVKTHINEPLQGAFAVTASAKTAWAMSVAGARVQEAATLAAEGKLDQKTQQDLQASFSAHANIATNNIEKQVAMSPDLGTEVATRFEAQLSEYQHVLAQVAQVSHVQTAELTNAVADENARVAGIRMNAESNANATSSSAAIAASRMRDAAMSAIDGSDSLVRSALGALAPSAAAQVALQLQDASNTISTGERYLTGNEVPRALATFRDALTATEKLGVFLQTSTAIHERTGLRITEPQQSDSSHGSDRGDNTAIAASGTSAATLADSEAPSSAPSNVRAARPMMFAAKVAPEATTASGSVATSATSSEATTSNASFQMGNDRQGGAGAASEDNEHGFFPIALPDTSDLSH